MVVKVRSENLQSHTERSSRPGPELYSVQADVYVWHNALLVVQIRTVEQVMTTGHMTRQPIAVLEAGSVHRRLNLAEHEASGAEWSGLKLANRHRTECLCNIQPQSTYVCTACHQTCPRSIN